MKLFFRTGYLILCVWAYLLAVPQDKINGWIHRGNGDVFPGELSFSGKRIVSVRRINPDNIDTTLHITPIMIDLNFYPSSDTDHVDSMMTFRGMGLYLVEDSPYILLRTVQNLQQPDTLGILLTVPGEEGRIHALYQHIYDYLSTSPADSCSIHLPFRILYNEKIWWNGIPGMWIPEFKNLMRDSEFENVWIVRDNTLMRDMIFGNIRMILSYEDLKKYETGKPAESDWFETLGNTGLQFPSGLSYGLSESVFLENKLSREIFLQLVSVLPAEFLGIDKRFGLLVPGYSASFAVFRVEKTECEFMVLEGIYVR